MLRYLLREYAHRFVEVGNGVMLNNEERLASVLSPVEVVALSLLDIGVLRAMSFRERELGQIAQVVRAN